MTKGKDKQPAEKPPLMGDCVMAGFPSPAEQYEFA